MTEIFPITVIRNFFRELKEILFQLFGRIYFIVK
jgi:hypothetical protein